MSDRITLKRDWSGSYYDVLLDDELVVEHLYRTEAVDTAKIVRLMLRVAEIVKAKPSLKLSTGRKFR